MNFEEAYKKVADGTASLEESAFVAQEIVKAQKIKSILDNDEPKKAELELADNDTIIKARKSYNLKNTIKIIIITLIVILLVAGGITAYIIGTARSSASKSAKIDQNQAVELARGAVKKYDPNVDVGTLVVKDIDKRLNTSEGLDRAIRIYEVELDQGVVEYEVRVNAVTGETAITDIDY